MRKQEKESKKENLERVEKEKVEGREDEGGKRRKGEGKGKGKRRKRREINMKCSLKRRKRMLERANKKGSGEVRRKEGAKREGRREGNAI